MKQLILFFLLTAFIITLNNSCKKDDDEKKDDNNTQTPSAKELAIQKYNSEYLGSAISTPGWTGSSSGCNAGTIPQTTIDKIIKRINYFRNMVGLVGNITNNTSQNQMCQECALMLKVNYSAPDNPHYPPTTWTCYTTNGATAAANSVLARSSVASPTAMHASNAVSKLIEDFGTGNEAVLHRRWLLYTKLKSVGVGSTDASCAIMYNNNFQTAPVGTPEFIAYPPNGFIPAPLVYERWSLSIPNANFSSATVTMKDASNNNVALTVIYKDGNSSYYAGDNSIVWVPQGINKTSDNVTYTVTVSNVSGTAKSSYIYSVTIIQVAK